MTVPSKEVSWGIIRYAPGSGDFPEDDAASFTVGTRTGRTP
jgi:hypothetical protein